MLIVGNRVGTRVGLREVGRQVGALVLVGARVGAEGLAVTIKVGKVETAVKQALDPG